jgi:putative 4-mercaptohistidine N1-methyltranferase
MGNEIYETDQIVSDYLFFHYAKDEDFMPWEFGPKEALGFTQRTVGYARGKQYATALDLGCAVGRSAFELTQYADRVLGIDFSHAFVHSASRLASGEVMHVRRNAGEFAIQAPNDLKLSAVTFQQGDAMNLGDMGQFDLIHASNLVCRLPKPKDFLSSIHNSINSGGRLILATPFSWLEEYTPRDEWPEGDSWQWLVDIMREHFALIEFADEPFMIREHSRKFQWCVSRVSVWDLK